MSNFYKLFVSFMMIGLVILGILAFQIGMQQDNNVNDTITNNALINNTHSQIESDLEGLRGQSQAQKAVFESEDPTTGFGSILLFSILSSGKVFNSMVVGIFNSVMILPATIFGIDPAISSVISTLLLITIIFGLWIVYKLGG